MGVLTEAELERRRGGLGGSDAPKVFGLGYGSRYALWADKFYGRPLDPMTAFQQRGHDLEDMIAHKAAERHGIDGIEPGGWCDHPDHDWMFANTDWHTTDKAVVIECKATDYRWKGSEWGDDGDPEGLPLHIDVQAHHQLEVTGAEMVIVAVMFVDTWELRTYQIKPDREIEARIVEAEHGFWFDHVVAGVAPPIGDPMSAWDAMRLLTANPDTTIELPATARQLVDAYQQARTDRLTAEKQEKALRAEIAALMGDNEIGYVGDTGPVVQFSNPAGGGARRLTISDPYQGDAK